MLLQYTQTANATLFQYSNMAGENEKQLRKALKAEVSPLLIGLRNDNKALWKAVKLLVSEQKKTKNVKIQNQIEPPEIQKVETINPQKEIKVNNFPEKIRVRGIKGLFASLNGNIRTGDNLLVKSILQVEKALKSHIFKVQVQNQKEIIFPKVQTVDFVKEIKTLLKELKQEVVQRVKIENSTPKDAIPVVLVDKDKKRFYNAISQIVNALSHASDVRSLFQKFFTEGRTFKVTTGIISTANNQNENEFVLIRNPAGSGIKVRFDDMKFQASGNIVVFVRVYRLPTITDTGVALAVSNTRTDGKPEKSQAFLAPTASDFGTLLEAFISTIENNFITENKLIDMLLEGEDMLITIQQSAASSQNASFDSHYVEEHI